jgi:transcriptional regulator NrdR family protein
MSDLRKAAQQVLKTWDTEDWFDADALRAALAQPERKPLTEEEIELAYREIWRDLSDSFSHTSAEWIEAGIRYAEKVHGIE